MGVEERVAYDVGKRGYMAGKPKGIVGGFYLFTDACMIRKESLSAGKPLEAGLAEVYLASERGNRKVPTQDVTSPQPKRFKVEIK